jgi:Outer membrane protein and related peptidoglycan-associated (lipo)proteins
MISFQPLTLPAFVAILLASPASAPQQNSQQQAGEIREVKCKGYLQRPNAEQKELRRERDKGLKLYPGDRLKCVGPGTLELVLHGQHLSVKEEFGWYPIPIPNNPPPDESGPSRVGRLKVKGVVTRRDADTFTVRDMNGVDTIVRLNDRTSVKTKGGFLRGGTNYAQTSILRGLNVEVQGRKSGSGELDAEKIRFTESDMRVARAVESRAAPLEDRTASTENKLKQTEANAQRLSGQLDELAAVSNAARGGAKAAQATADAAVAGVNATNERISALDDYTPQDTASVIFKSGSAALSPESKTILDNIATKALNSKGYVLEISGFADSRGSVNLNRQLSQRRADAVIRYLIENHNIPLRRIVTPYGYGESNPVADNDSREGRAQNRRVEIKLLVNKGLTSPAKTSG